MKKSYILLIVLISNLFGQTFTGNVKDVSGTEISYVIIEELNSESQERNWTISDESGGFSINITNDCLLYTSPSPRDLSTSRMPSSA